MVNLTVSVLNLLQLDDEFRYLQRKKNVVKELSDTRRKVRYLVEHELLFSRRYLVERYFLV